MQWWIFSRLMWSIFLMVQVYFFLFQEFQKRMKAIPAINKFLQPGSQRKPPPDEVYVKTVKNVFSHLFK